MSLIGEKNSMLTIIDDKKIDGKVKCRCDCGEIKYVRYDNFKSGNTKSCGCFQKKRGRSKLYRGN